MDIRYELPPDQRACPACGGELSEMAGQYESSERITTVKLTYHVDRSCPILDRIWQWATVQVGLPRSDFGKAVRYMLERWTGLTRFVDDPRIPLDNNAAERALRGPVVGRKNHYGSRSLRGTQVAAIFYTLCETARLAGIDPQVYLLTAVHAAIARPGAVTLPEDLTPATVTA